MTDPSAPFPVPRIPLSSLPPDARKALQRVIFLTLKWLNDEQGWSEEDIIASGEELLQKGLAKIEMTPDGEYFRFVVHPGFRDELGMAGTV